MLAIKTGQLLINLINANRNLADLREALDACPNEGEIAVTISGLLTAKEKAEELITKIDDLLVKIVEN
jgi:hypothetical protein